MCFSKEISGEKPINVIPENPKLILEEFDDNCDYIDLDNRTELSCDNKTLSSALNLLLTENVGNERPDLVLLCKTWLNPNNFAKIDIPNYRLFGNIRSYKLGGGTGILVHKTLRSQI